ncbi:MAG: PIN domain-containing protein [Thermoflexibacter sp.]|nr:PIN domain-containing protein [Thermoflexibacter sp.]
MYLLDTNILVLAIRNSTIWQQIQEDLFLRFGNTLISIVSEGELYSLADQFGWGTPKWQNIQSLLQKVTIVPIDTPTLVQAYREIDTYSQGKHLTLANQEGFSAKNMGKNDLWIAATATTTGATLISTDNDFAHLDKVFFDFMLVKI